MKILTPKNLNTVGLDSSDIFTACKVLATLQVGDKLRVPNITICRDTVNTFTISIADDEDDELDDNPLFK